MPPPQPAPQVQRLVYREPQLGRDYWVLDDALPDPLAVRERLLAREDWTQGAPYRPESWPGMRAQPALQPEELAPLEAWVCKQTGRKRLFQPPAPGQLNHNCVQLVGVHEALAAPHTDSRRLCRYAGVLYLSPEGAEVAGTTFFRVRQPDGSPGGNTLPARYDNLVEALGTRFVPPDLFMPDVSVDLRFNRLLLYRADLIHSATSYFGREKTEKRMTAVFFWQAA